MDESWRPILRLFKIFPASEEKIIIFFVITFSIIIALISFQIITYLIRRRRTNIEQWDWFYRMCEAKDLSVEEMKILRSMIRKTKVRNPTKIFKFVKVFEKCVNNEFRKARFTDDEREEFTEDISEIRRKLLFDRFPSGRILESTRGINPAQRVRIGFEFDGKRHYIHTWVLDTKEDAILVYIPEVKGEQEAFSAGQPVDVYFWRETDAGYMFSTTIQDVENEPIGVLYLNHSGELQRTQRRHFYRLDIFLPVNFRVLTDEQKKILREERSVPFPKEEKPKTGEVKSLSGGGSAFISDTVMNKGEILWIEIELSESWKISNIYGKVIRCKKIFEAEYKVFAEFLLIEDSQREEIIRYVSAKQREKVNI